MKRVDWPRLDDGETFRKTPTQMAGLPMSFGLNVEYGYLVCELCREVVGNGIGAERAVRNHRTRCGSNLERKGAEVARQAASLMNGLQRKVLKYDERNPPVEGLAVHGGFK